MPLNGPYMRGLFFGVISFITNAHNYAYNSSSISHVLAGFWPHFPFVRLPKYKFNSWLQ